MSPIIQFKRGLFDNLPSLRAGEPGITTDRSDLFVGGADGNKFYGSHRYWTRENGTDAAVLNLVDATGDVGVSLRSPADAGAGVTYTLPVTGNSGHFLKLGSEGVLEWATVTDGATFDNAILTGVTTITNADVQSGQINGTTIGLTTAAAANFTELEYDNSTTIGISTVGELYVGTTKVLSTEDGLVALSGIATIDATTKATLEATLALAPNDFTSLNVSGIATFQQGIGVTGHTELDGSLNVTGLATFSQQITASGGVLGNLTGNVTGDLTGVASTATKLQNARDFSVSGDVATSSAVSFDGTGNVDLIVTLSNTFSANTSGIITASGGFVGDLTGDVTGTASTATRATTVDTTATSDDVSYYVPFVANSGSTTSEIVRVDAGISYNPSTNTLDVPNIETTAISHENGTNSITIDSLGNVGLSTNLTVEGNLTVKGQTTTVNTETLLVKDPVIEVGMEDDGGTLVPPTTNSTTDVGTVLHYYNDGSAKKASFFWDHEDNRVAIASSVTVSDNDITVQNWGTLEIGSLLMNGGLTVNDCAGSSAVISCTGSERFLENITVDAGEF